MAETVAVTGADGFIGSHLVEALVRRGDDVRALAQYNSWSSWGWLDQLEPDVLGAVDVRLGDVRDSGSMDSFVEGADTVVHLAALIAIPYSYEAPQSYIATNIGGTCTVLEAARRHETPRLVHTSTSEVYGTARQVPIDESHPLQAQSPYAASKVAADKLVESYHASFGLPAVTLRPFNTYGPRQSARAIVPTVITQIASGARRLRLGSLHPRRDLNFVSDTVAAFLSVIDAPEKDVVGQVLNAGSGVEVSVGDLVDLIATLMGVTVEVTRDEDRVRPPASEVDRLVADSSALRTATGWRPTVDLARGLAATADWFLAPGNLDWYAPGRYVR